MPSHIVLQMLRSCLSTHSSAKICKETSFLGRFRRGKARQDWLKIISSTESFITIVTKAIHFMKRGRISKKNGSIDCWTLGGGYHWCFEPRLADPSTAVHKDFSNHFNKPFSDFKTVQTKTKWRKIWRYGKNCTCASRRSTFHQILGVFHPPNLPRTTCSRNSSKVTPRTSWERVAKGDSQWLSSLNFRNLVSEQRHLNRTDIPNF